MHTLINCPICGALANNVPTDNQDSVQPCTVFDTEACQDLYDIADYYQCSADDKHRFYLGNDKYFGDDEEEENETI